MSQEHELSGLVIGCAMQVHCELGPGFLEIVYRNALCVELARQGIKYATEEQIKVYYKGTTVGAFCADVLVEGSLIIELKAVERLVPAHGVQLVNYLKATRLEVGLLLNFGARSLEFKRKYRDPVPKNPLLQSRS